MKRRHILQTTAAALAASALGANLARAAGWPVRPIKIVVPFGPGGEADVTARIVGQKLSEQLHQSVIIENRPGAGGVVAGELVARAAPDGYTLLLMTNGTAVSEGLFKHLPFDAQKDFAPISTLGFFDLVIVVPADSRFKTLADLLAYARGNPDKLSLGTINIGSTQNLAAQLFKTTAGLHAQIVPFNGNGAVLTVLRSGQIDAAVVGLSSIMSQIRAGAVRALAAMGEKRAPDLPQVPTVRESGGALAQFNVASWNALAAPAKTPPDVLQRLNQEVVAALQSPDVIHSLTQINVQPRPGTPAQLAELLGSEIRRWGGVIKSAGIPQQ
ncbi:tripartite tricarboxylate transporter substrate binding protein [Polaromonas sp. C04]|uniref:Bug family tripartite tricarboxylate transporter substrate binding protein n=1 Tax=Polaromonas sp. C04 TaxID=1945857 RepID=UPI000984CBDF|nr:tripartite tricarboxylate transporter substrate binding protein [Polaromonas sp. C04]OOG58146.1 tripartite tricarboxylate transporter receptor protein [Polaromonas sp. C04]